MAGRARLSFVGQCHVASFATVRAVVKAVGTQPDVVLALADRAVLLAGTRVFRLVALRADNLRMGWHKRLR